MTTNIDCLCTPVDRMSQQLKIQCLEIKLQRAVIAELTAERDAHFERVKELERELQGEREKCASIVSAWEQADRELNDHAFG